MSIAIAATVGVLTAQGGTDGYVTIASNAGYLPGALGWLNKADGTLPQRVTITELKGTTQLGIRFIAEGIDDAKIRSGLVKVSGLGRSDCSAYLTGSLLNVERQVVEFTSTFSIDDVALIQDGKFLKKSGGRIVGGDPDNLVVSGNNRIVFTNGSGVQTTSSGLTFTDATKTQVIVTADATGFASLDLTNSSSETAAVRNYSATAAGSTMGLTNARRTVIHSLALNGMIIGSGADGLFLCANNAEVMRLSSGVVTIGSTGVDSSHRLRVVGSGANLRSGLVAAGSGGFAFWETGSTADNERAIMAGGANDASGTLMGIAKANGSFFYGAATHVTATLGTLNTAGDVVLAPGNSERVRYRGNLAIASGASATWNAVDWASATVVLSGSTNITTATGFNQAVFRASTISAASALTITNAATVYIAGAPSGAGAGPATITNAYAFWVDTGLARFDGNGTRVFELPADATGNATAATGRVPILVGGVTKYLRYFDD